MRYKIRQTYKCPICGNPKAEIVWKRKDEKVIGVKCQRSHEHKKNSVTLIEVK